MAEDQQAVPESQAPDPTPPPADPGAGVTPAEPAPVADPGPIATDLVTKGQDPPGAEVRIPDPGPIGLERVAEGDGGADNG